MGKYLLYVALADGDGTSAEFDELDEVSSAVNELIEKTFESGRNLVTFSIGDMSETVSEPTYEIRHEEDCPAGQWKGRECSCPAPLVEKEEVDGQG